jgi:DNA repair protein SbcC/Rad50
VLDDPELAGVDARGADAAGADAPGAEDAADEDLSALASVALEAERAADEAARALALREDEVRSLRVQADRLTTALESWAPVRDESLRAEAISRLVRGTGHDNQLQMRLSAYVLATRLDQVVAAANERLGHMRDQRYLLQRTGRAERRGSQAGLGLEVVDQWTGDVRAPSTLSGGETFVVSLSLALGLADVVTHEAGGTEVETLFVDEGFGSLDADTLDDVMDRLDALRAGGRIVGVVSHVPEMRTRIPTQVHVAKERTGSTVSVRTLVG